MLGYENFKNKNILITGSAGNIGSKLSYVFLEKGANLILIDNNKSSQKYLITNLRKISKDKNKIDSYIINLESKKDRTKIINQIKKKYKNIDILINNASLVGTSDLKGWNTKFEKQSVDTWSKALEVNLTAPFHLIQSLIKLIQKSKNPSIINISSIYGFLAANWSLYKDIQNVGNPAAYSVSKAGVIQLTKWLSTALAPKIRVNSISPGGIKKSVKKFILRYENLTPLKQMLDVDDVVEVILFLASKKSKNITGQNIVVDGGWSVY